MIFEVPNEAYCKADEVSPHNGVSLMIRVPYELSNQKPGADQLDVLDQSAVWWMGEFNDFFNCPRPHFVMHTSFEIYT